MKTTEELIKSYEPDEAEKNRIGEIVWKRYTSLKGSSNNPFAIIVIGQPGAGKSGLMGYSENQFETAISLDIDDLRGFHPKYDEVRQNHPEIFEKVTGRFATSLIHYLTPRLIAEKHNLILHKTRGDDAVIDDTIIPLKQNGYNVIIRVLSVNHLESKMSALERSIAERDDLGCCRWVLRNYHNTQYNGIVDLVDKLDKEKFADLIEVFVRGKTPVEPELMYSKVVNKNILSNPHMKTEDGELVIGNYAEEKYNSPKQALIETRELFVPQILGKLEERLAKAIGKCDGSHIEDEYITEIVQIAQDYVSKLNSNGGKYSIFGGEEFQEYFGK